MSENEYGSSQHQFQPRGKAQAEVKPIISYQDEFNFHCKKLQELFYGKLRSHSNNSALEEQYDKLSAKYKDAEAKNAQLVERLEVCERQLVREEETAQKSAFKAMEEVDGSLNGLLEELGLEFDVDASPIEKVGYFKEIFLLYQQEIDNRNNDIEKLEDQLEEARRHATQDEQQGSLKYGLRDTSAEKDEEIEDLRNLVAKMERELQETRCFTEELRTYKEDVERYRNAYGRAVAEREALAEKYDEEQQKWSLEAIRLQDEIEKLVQKDTGTSKGGLFKSKKDTRIEQLQSDLEFKIQDYKRLSLQFGRYRSEKEKEILSKDEEIATLKQMLNSLQSYRKKENSDLNAEKMKDMYDALAQREAQLIELRSQKETLEREYNAESAHWQTVVGVERSALKDLQERHAAMLRDRDEQLSAKEAAIVQLRDQEQHYKSLYERMVAHASQTGTGKQLLAEPSLEQQPIREMHSRRGHSTFEY